MAGAPRRPLKRRANPLYAEQIAEVDWKDVGLLRTFVPDRGKICARHPIELARSSSTQRRRSGLTPPRQRQVAVAIRNVREMALRPHPRNGRG